MDIDFFLSKPVTEWFPLDPMTYWTTQYTMPAYHGGLAEGFDTGHYGGWENFLWNTVRPAREAAQKAAEKDLIKTLVAIAATTTKGASINA